MHVCANLDGKPWSSPQVAVKALCKKRLWQEALNREGAFTAIFPRGVRAAPLPALVPAFATFAQGLAWQHALLLLQELRTVQISRTGRSSRNPMRRHMKSLTAAISACTKSDQWDQALLLLSVFRADAVQPNVITYSAVASKCSTNRWLACFALTQKFSDLVACNSAITIGGLESWLRALDRFDAVSCMSLRPDVVTYGAAVACGSWQVASLLLEKSCKCHLGSSIGCGAAISACEENAACWRTALGLLEFGNVRRLQSSIVLCNAASSACEKGMRWQAAIDFLNACQRFVKPNIISYNAAISGCKQAAQWLSALDLFSELRHETYLDVITCNALIASFDQMAGWKQSLQMVQFLSQQRLEANAVTYGSLISACSKAKEWQRAVCLLAKAQQLTVGEAAVYNVVLRGCPWRAAATLLTSMREAALLPSILANDVVMQAYSDQGQQEHVWELLVNTAEKRSALEYLWGLALLSCKEPDVIHSACVEAFQDFRESIGNQSPNEHACLWWSTAMLGARNKRLDMLRANQTMFQIAEFQLDELVTVASGSVDCESSLFAQSLLLAAQRRTEAVFAQLPTESFSLVNSGMHVLGDLALHETFGIETTKASEACEASWHNSSFGEVWDWVHLR
ncbi:unnamed protein product [Durusdinium trenchii]|uniref:Pentatricopeptide repeat-containing protein, chloroplastic n=1 Tax=Durusdinium trenchii TaxID=1381693 RepID=A0ABP0SUM0_9DINO